MNIAEIKQYRRSVAVVQDLPQFLRDNDKVWTYFQYHTKSDYGQVVNLLKTNAKPLIVPVNNLRDSRGLSCWGKTPCRPEDPLRGVAIEITRSLLVGLEMAKLKSTIFDTGFFLATTLLHELVHFTRALNKLPADKEYGEGFVVDSFGGVIGDTNAAFYNRYQHSFINLKWEIRHDEVINNSNKY